MVKGDADAYAVLDARVAPETDPGKRLQIRLVQARTAVTGGRWKEAATRYETALAEIPSDTPEAAQQRLHVRSEKVQALAMHDIDSVQADLDQLDASWPTPGWPATIDQRMGSLLAAGRAEEALTWLEWRLAQSPVLAGHPAAHQCRGDVELKLGRGKEARQSYTRALESTPDPADQRAYGAMLMAAFGTQQWKSVGEFRDRLVALNPALAADPQLRTIAAQAALRRDEPGITLTLTEATLPAETHFRELRDLTRGEAQLRLGRIDDALALTNEAIQRCQGTAPTEPARRAFLMTVHALRAQAFNTRQDFRAALEAASKAIETSDPLGAALDGQTAMVRIGALMQRSLAQFRLGNKEAANTDVDAAINAFQGLRQTAIFALLENGLEFGRLETSLWYGKGVVLHSESRSEEALAAYSRAERLETQGSAAALGMGFALSATGAYEKALAVFERALTRAASVQERSDALAGKGRALVRLKRFDEAIDALQAALDVRLTEPDNDPDVFELLGIAYDALKRNGAALRAFRRVWALTPKDKRSANLARGVTAAELRLGNPATALEFLDALPERLKDERTLLLNRALALDALGQRSAAIACLVKAREAGLDSAQRELHRLDAPAGLGRWTHFWFGAQARQRRKAGGTILLLIAATGFAAPLFQWLVEGKLDWYLLLLPSAVALALLALPNMKAISAEAGPFKLEAEPQAATGGEAAAPAAPESFSVPAFGTVAVAVTEAKTAVVWTEKPKAQ